MDKPVVGTDRENQAPAGGVIPVDAAAVGNGADVMHCLPAIAASTISAVGMMMFGFALLHHIVIAQAVGALMAFAATVLGVIVIRAPFLVQHPMRFRLVAFNAGGSLVALMWQASLAFHGLSSVSAMDGLNVAIIVVCVNALMFLAGGACIFPIGYAWEYVAKRFRRVQVLGCGQHVAETARIRNDDESSRP
jgi:hypothetical protein